MPKSKVGGKSRRRIHLQFDDSGKMRGKSEEIVEFPDPTEQEKRVLEIMRSSLELGDDVARASARFLRDSLMPRIRDKEEAPEEFDTEEFQALCDHLTRLTIIKRLLPVFGLENYEQEILSHFIDKAFGKPKASKRATVFRGGDEAFLDHMARTSG